MAIIFGYVLHQSGLCTVRSVAEILKHRRVTMLLGIIKTVVWVLTIFLIWYLLTGQKNGFKENYSFNITSLFGGFLFGVGAAINGGCAFSTLTKLVNGQVWMLTTLVGFGVGIGITTSASKNISLPEVQPSLLADEVKIAPLLVLIVLLVFMGFELFRIWRSRGRKVSMRRKFFSGRFSQATYSLMLGLCAGLLFLLQGKWAYTSMLKEYIQQSAIPANLLNRLDLYLFIAVLVGMLASAVLKKSSSLNLKPTPKIVQHLIGGALMGAAVVFIPGGNDVLILINMPGLSFHAVPTFASLLGGIAITLAIQRKFVREKR